MKEFTELKQTARQAVKRLRSKVASLQAESDKLEEKAKAIENLFNFFDGNGSVKPAKKQKSAAKSKSKPKPKAAAKPDGRKLISPTQKRQIRSFRAMGLSGVKIAKKLGISESAVYRVLDGKPAAAKPATKSANHSRKKIVFSEAQLKQMRRLRSMGKSYADIGKVMQVSMNTITRAFKKLVPQA